MSNNTQQYTLYNPRSSVEPRTRYMVDVFCRDWSSVLDAYTVFVQGGTHFLVNGKNLLQMIKQCPTLEESEQSTVGNIKKTKKKREICFETLKKRSDIIAKYRETFYRFKDANTLPDFEALVQRPRNKRFGNRLKFSFLVIKNIQCKRCENNVCVYNALKSFYENDKKCVDEVDRLVIKEAE
ncbi:lef-2 [Agrotis segetum granulovirus]|uniref:Lef-2 n=1 Tax=Agrotis segetum granulosis virus TaxID=10464 RepID=A0A023MID8_GVAS|nr:lef-2 [Agrotis segetum granulovirus]AHN92078.1 lef-2 [Agrotis segetum granulovirus]AKN63313.1 lef-2 [Agrotis segetum granulovirus]